MLPTPTNIPEYKRGLPWIGAPREFLALPYEFLREGYQQCGSVFTFRIFGRRFVCNISPEAHKQYFEANDDLLDHRPAYQFIKPLLGERALFFLPENEYLSRRELINPLFKGHVLKSYLSAITEHGHEFVQNLKNQPVIDDFCEAVGPVLFATAVQSLVGKDFYAQTGDTYYEYFHQLTGLIDMVTPSWVPIPRFIKGRKAKKIIVQALDEWIVQRRRNPVSPPDFFQELVDTKSADGSPVSSDEDIISTLILLLWAGHDTTNLQITWFLYDLLRHPDYMKLCQQQVDEVCGDTDDRDLTWDQVNALTCLEMAAKETERINPVAFMQVRIAARDFDFAGVPVRKNDTVVLAPCIAGRAESLFPKADAYNPYRFFPQHTIDVLPKNARHEPQCPYTGQPVAEFQNRSVPETHKLMGFGGGVHRCPGAVFARTEMRVIAALLLKNFDLTLIGEPHYAKLGMTYGLKGLKVGLKARSKPGKAA